MYLIVGLGNPGRQYEATRHNMGFDVIDKLVEEYNVPQSGVKFNAMYGKGRIEGQPVILMKPLSYMNLSGGPVRDMANYFKIDPGPFVYSVRKVLKNYLRLSIKASTSSRVGITRSAPFRVVMRDAAAFAKVRSSFRFSSVRSLRPWSST